MSSVPATANPGYEIGTATADITPPVGTPLAGNFRDDYASQGVHTPLSARAVVVRQGGAAVAIVSADLLTVPEALVEQVRRRIGTAVGLSPSQVMVAVTHTHSGPAVELVAGPPAGEAVFELLAQGMTEACVQASRTARPAGLWHATARDDARQLVYNRRLRLRDGRTVMNWTLPAADTIDRELGPVDAELGVLLAGPQADRPEFVAVNVPLHAAVLAGDNWLINADWPGYYYAAIRAIFGPAAVGMFLQGAQGNINHIDARDPLQGRGYKEAQRIGDAMALLAAQSRAAARPVSGPLAWSTRVLQLPPRQISPAQQAWAQGVVAEAAASGQTPAGQTDGIPSLIFAREQLAMAGRCEPHAAEIQVLKIGDLAVVGLPGEFFVEFGLEIKRRSPAAATLVVGLANGSLGYVPTEVSFAEGGYEPTSWRYSKLAPEAGKMCVEAAVEQLAALFAKSNLAS